jgi:MOSC domain-containing protein YiiM
MYKASILVALKRSAMRKRPAKPETIAGLESDSLAIGDRLQIGDVVLEVTSPRIPCVTLAQRMGDPAFLKKFRAAERPGVYCRVIREGFIHAGDTVTYEPYAGEQVTILEVFRDFFDPELNETAIRRHLAVPIAIRARVDKEAQLRDVMRGA